MLGLGGEGGGRPHYGQLGAGIARDYLQYDEEGRPHRARHPNLCNFLST